VELHRVGGDAELVGDLLVTQALLQKLQDLFLATGEGLDKGRRLR
jgi:hypothetical protein